MPRMKWKVLGKQTKLALSPKQAADAKDYGAIKKTDGGYLVMFILPQTETTHDSNN